MNSKFKPVIPLVLAVMAAGTVRMAHGASPAAACSLVTTSQVSAILGFAVDAGKGSGSDCQWSEAGAGVYGKGAVLQILGKSGSTTPEEQFNTLKAPDATKVVTKLPVSGVGDDAVYAIFGGKTAILAVKKGTFVFKIRAYGFPLEQAKDIEKAFAQAILAKQ